LKHCAAAVTNAARGEIFDIPAACAPRRSVSSG
jgi:hypothetical protein